MINDKTWFPIAEQRKDKDGVFKWTILDDCPFFHTATKLLMECVECKIKTL